MLGKDDRIVFDFGACSFQTQRGRKITLNDHVSWTKPTAHVHPKVASLFGSYLASTLRCEVVGESMPNRFIYVLTTEPRLAPDIEPLHFVVVIAPDEKEPLVNKEGAEAIAWFLEALFAKKFTFESSAERLCWRPPPKREGYAPLVRPKGEASPNSPPRSPPRTKRSG